MDIDLDLVPSARPRIFEEIRKRKGGSERLLQVATFSTEKTRSAILSACRGYRSDDYPKGIDNDIANYLTSLIPQNRGFLPPLDEVIHGDKEKGTKPNTIFINEVNKYPRLLEIMQSIEGLINSRGIHASGVIIYNQDPWNTGAVMTAPDGSLITQFELHTAEKMGDVKFDFLVTEVLEKEKTTIELLQKDGLINPKLTLREAYDQYLHPDVINLNDERLWRALHQNAVIDCFQFNTPVGVQATKLIKPSSPQEMTAASALMRLMAEKGKESPLSKYARFKQDISLWYQEMRDYNLTLDQMEILKKYYEQDYGVPPFQESVMSILMDKDISNFTLGEANAARKLIAKKKMNEIPLLRQKFFDQCTNANLAKYVWETAVLPQLGYSFSVNHSLPYGFIGIQTLVLATKFHPVYWNCACLIVNSGGKEELDDEEEIVDIYETEDDRDEYEYIDLPDRSGKKKRKIKATDYGRVATAIGVMQKAGIEISPPDINQSQYQFVPNANKNCILYGLMGITRISGDAIKSIVANRPYESIADFTKKVKLNKLQMVNLIKSGAFDKLYLTRQEAMREYIRSIADHKNDLNLRNMQMLINYNMLPASLDIYRRLFNFTKYVRKHKNGDNFDLDEKALTFLNNYLVDEFDDYVQYDENESAYMSQALWDKRYKKDMISVKNYITAHKAELLERLNDILYQEEYDKYCTGTISKWEMDSISFYYHAHELAKVDNGYYNISNFFEMPEEGFIVSRGNNNYPIYKLTRIAGTVLDKDKNKKMIKLLTANGVVTVKFYQTQYAKYDKQISVKGADGHKKVIEKSWFSRGNKLIITGTRRDDNFVPKLYKNSIYPSAIGLINSVNEDKIDVQYFRFDED